MAEHVAHGLEQGDEAAVDEVRAAVAAIAYRAPRVALDLLDRAAGASADHRNLIDIERIEPRAWLGEIDGAAADAEELLHSGLVPSTRRPALRSILAGLRVLQRRTNEAVEQFELGLQECDDDRLRARLGAQSAMARMSAGAFGDAAEEAARARQLAIEVGDEGARSMAAGILGRLSTYTNDWAGGLALVEEAVEAADADLSGEAHRFLPWFFCGVTRLEVGQVEGATEALTRGMDRALELETEWALPLYHALAAAIAWRTGRWDDALVEAGSSRRAAEDTGTVVANAWMLAIEATVHLQRNELDEATDALAAAGALVAEGEALLGVDVLSLAGALVAEARGDAAGAREELAGAWELLVAVGVPSAQTVLGVDLVRLAADGGDTDRATSMTDALVALAHTVPQPLFEAQAEQAKAFLDPSAATASAAVERARAVPFGPDLFVALRHQARCLALAGEMSRARTARDEALAIAADLGATRLRRGLLADLRPFKLGRAPRATTRPRFGWAALTATEREVVELVAAGLTNADIAEQRGSSRRTVESHLVRVYRKLDVRTRTELAVLANEQAALATGRP